MDLEIRRIHQPSRTRCLSERLAAPGGHDEPARTLALATALLEDAVRENASDIHLDPAANGYDVRLRIDGVLVNTVRLPRDKVAEGITSIAEFQSGGGMGFFARDPAPAAHSCCTKS